MGKAPTTKDEQIAALVLRLNEVAEETQAPGYHGHGLIPRFFDEVRAFVQSLDYHPANQDRAPGE